jgi:hypothetical protein
VNATRNWTPSEAEVADALAKLKNACPTAVENLAAHFVTSYVSTCLAIAASTDDVDHADREIRRARAMLVAHQQCLDEQQGGAS